MRQREMTQAASQELQRTSHLTYFSFNKYNLIDTIGAKKVLRYL